MRSDILGVKIDQIDLAGAILRINCLLSGSGQNLVVTVNPEFILAASGDDDFRRTLNYASMAVADGIGLVFAARFLLGEKLIRVTGVDLCHKLLTACSPAKIYLLGGTEGAAAAVRTKYLNSRIVGAESGGKISEGKWELEDNEAVVSRINASGANLLLVAFGQVKQEMWISANLAKLPGVRVAIGVGGTFDYLSGMIKRAPAAIRKLGFEWLYRLIREPKRWKRIWNATAVFGWLVLKKKIKG